MNLKYQKMKTIFLIIFLTLFMQLSAQQRFDIPHEKFKDYWYAGKAEIANYDLKQARYGDIHDGRAVLIFVTEDFSKSKHVKLDNPGQNPDDAVKVMKLNFTKKFMTGIYPYSMMTSVFTPVEVENYPLALKLTTSSQEWCGHTFTQANLRNDRYLVKEFSYFEKEGDKIYQLEDVMMEDDIWNLIRINPNKLPLGEVTMIPSTLTARLKHYELNEERVFAKFTDEFSGDGLLTYSIEYKNMDRKLKITFRKEFPFEIESWEEIYFASWNGEREKFVTEGVINKRIQSDYWNKNRLKDLDYRDKLNLPKH